MKIIIIDSHVLFRQGLASMLNDYPDLQVVGEAGTLMEGVKEVCNHDPDIVLMALNLPDQPGVEGIGILVDECPGLKIIVMANSEKKEQLLAAIRAGAKGFIVKRSSLSKLIASIHAVQRDEVALTRRMASQVTEEYSRLSSLIHYEDSRLHTLTFREKEVLGQLGLGLTNAEIGRVLNIAENTVKVHVHNILAKLHMDSRREAGKFARSNGLIHKKRHLQR